MYEFILFEFLWLVFIENLFIFYKLSFIPSTHKTPHFIYPPEYAKSLTFHLVECNLCCGDGGGGFLNSVRINRKQGTYLAWRLDDIITFCWLTSKTSFWLFSASPSSCYCFPFVPAPATLIFSLCWCNCYVYTDDSSWLLVDDGYVENVIKSEIMIRMMDSFVS